MSHSQRERLLAFVSSVILCCVMSGSLGLLAKKSRASSAASQRTARVATPHDVVSSSLPGSSQDATAGVAVPDVESDINTFFNGSPDAEQASDNQQAMTTAVRAAQPVSGSIVTVAILCLGATVCCVLTAVGALLLLRGPRRDHVYLSEEGDSDEVMKVKMLERKQSKGASLESLEDYSLVRELVDDITPEDAV